MMKQATAVFAASNGSDCIQLLINRHVNQMVTMEDMKQLRWHQGFICDGARRYGVPAPFFQSKEKKLFVMCIINE